jgi:hypothetical protein
VLARDTRAQRSPRAPAHAAGCSYLALLDGTTRSSASTAPRFASHAARPTPRVPRPSQRAAVQDDALFRKHLDVHRAPEARPLTPQAGGLLRSWNVIVMP